MNRQHEALPQAHGRTAPAQLGDWMEQVYGPLWQGMSDFWAKALDPSAWARPPARGQHRPGCCHGDHACDPCACTVCDADLSVMAYVGETRVFPITVENTRPKARTVTAHISKWVTSDGEQVALPTQVSPAQFQLGPCEEKTIAVLVRIALPKDKGDTLPHRALDTAEPAPREAAVSSESLDELASAIETRTGATDIHACRVLYANLSLDGCDIRPIRLAVAILPRACNAHFARCGCGCC